MKLWGDSHFGTVTVCVSAMSACAVYLSNTAERLVLRFQASNEVRPRVMSQELARELKSWPRKLLTNWKRSARITTLNPSSFLSVAAQRRNDCYAGSESCYCRRLAIWTRVWKTQHTLVSRQRRVFAKPSKRSSSVGILRFFCGRKERKGQSSLHKFLTAEMRDFFVIRKSSQQWRPRACMTHAAGPGFSG